MHKSLPLVMCLSIVLTGLGGCNVDTVSPTPLTPLVSPSLPTSTPTATHVPTATPAPTPTLTPTPAPTPTPTPTPGDILTEEERQRLYESSLKYVALTHREAISVARGLRFLTDEGHPSNMCGPLAMAILRDAGLVDRSIILHDYWLLDPSEPSDQWLLESTFPRHRYLWYNSPVSIGDFAWSAFPLQAGDLLYLFAGPGTFEHIIVVSRVDEMGRLYSVSNVNTTEGFVIREVMLYDPNQPGVGQFYEWTNPDNISMGLTGRGGFLLWRRMGRLQEETSKMSAQLDVELDELLTVRGGHWNVAIKDTDGDLLYHRGAEEILTAPSVVGIPTAMLLFHALDQQGVGDYDLYLASNDLHGHTFQHLLEAMLVDASPSATQDLARWVKEQADEEIILRDWGLYQTTLMPHQSTAHDVATILAGLHSGRIGTPGARALVLGYLRQGGLEEDLDGITLHTYVDEAWSFPVSSSDTGKARLLAAAEGQDGTYAIVIYAFPPRYGEQGASAGVLQQTTHDTLLTFVDIYSAR